MTRSQDSRADRRRREILDAALACFLTKGVESTTLQDIRDRSGASTGSIYHLFSGKDAIAGELFLSSLRELHDRLVAAVAGAVAPKQALHELVASYLDWTAGEPDRARFLLVARRATVTATVDDELRDENRAFLRRMGQHMTQYVEAGQLRWMPFDIFIAVVLGPMQEYARQYLAGVAKSAPLEAARELAEAAWRAVRAVP